MDQITTAITIALANLAKPAIRDSYEALKALIGRKYGALKNAVDEAELAPNSPGPRELVAEEVEKARAAEDPELQAAASSLRDCATAMGISAPTTNVSVVGKHNITVTNAGVVKIAPPQ